MHTLMLGSDVHNGEDKLGTVAGAVINPNRNDVDYVIVNPGLLGGREYYVPRSRIAWEADGSVNILYSHDELGELARPTFFAESGTLQDNIGNFLLARTDTPIRDTDGTVLGTLNGIVVDHDDFVVRGVLLDGAPGETVPIARVVRYSDEDEGALVIHRTEEASNAAT